MTNQEIFDKMEVDTTNDLSISDKHLSCLDLEIDNNNIELCLYDGCVSNYMILSHPQALRLAKYILTSLNIEI